MRFPGKIAEFHLFSIFFRGFPSSSANANKVVIYASENMEVSLLFRGYYPTTPSLRHLCLLGSSRFRWNFVSFVYQPRRYVSMAVRNSCRAFLLTVLSLACKRNFKLFCNGFASSPKLVDVSLGRRSWCQDMMFGFVYWRMAGGHHSSFSYSL
jgi:hypothetical protein